MSIGQQVLERKRARHMSVWVEETERWGLYIFWQICVHREQKQFQVSKMKKKGQQKI